MPNNQTVKIGVVGVGHIFEHYLKAAGHVEGIEIVALADKDPAKERLANEKRIRFFSNANDMAQDPEIDAIAILTPTDTHKDVALELMAYQKPLLLEKPITLKAADLEELHEASQDYGTACIPLFHAAESNEVQEFVAKYADQVKRADKLEWKALFADPHMKDGELDLEAARSLEGSWHDSGINALSVVFNCLQPDSIKFKRIEGKFAPNGTNISAKADFEALLDGKTVPVTIETSWERERNYKCSKLSFEEQDGPYDKVNKSFILNHSVETLTSTFSSKRGAGHDTTAFNFPTPERLTNHYVNILRNARESILRQQSGWDYAAAVHKPYFAAIEALEALKPQQS